MESKKRKLSEEIAPNKNPEKSSAGVTETLTYDFADDPDLNGACRKCKKSDEPFHLLWCKKCNKVCHTFCLETEPSETEGKFIIITLFL